MTRTLVRPADEERQALIATLVATKWNCTVHTFARYASVDWWMERDGRVVAVAEVKCRTVEMDAYPTVYLALTKWYALMHLAAGLSCAGIFVAAYRDGVRWVDVSTLGDIETEMLGRTDRDDVPTDVEPILPVPMSRMGRL